MFVSRKKYKELEDKLIHQERLFEAKLTSIQQDHEIEVDSLVTKYEEDIKYLKHELNFAKANEIALNNMTGDLAQKIARLESNFDSFPSKRFNHDKAIEVLTKDLSAKALATFLHKLVEALGHSHLQSLNNYVLRKLTNFKEKENVNN